MLRRLHVSHVAPLPLIDIENEWSRPVIARASIAYLCVEPGKPDSITSHASTHSLHIFPNIVVSAGSQRSTRPLLFAPTPACYGVEDQRLHPPACGLFSDASQGPCSYPSYPSPAAEAAILRVSDAPTSCVLDSSPLSPAKRARRCLRVQHLTP